MEAEGRSAVTRAVNGKKVRLAVFFVTGLLELSDYGGDFMILYICKLHLDIQSRKKTRSEFRVKLFNLNIDKMANLTLKHHQKQK